MFDFLQTRRNALAQMKDLDAQAPKAGDAAADFLLRDVDGENPVRLSDFRGNKPVVLVFGSFT